MLTDCYKAYGLTVLSEIDLPELQRVPACATPDVRIVLAASMVAPAALPAAEGRPTLLASTDAFEFEVAGLVAYRVEYGDTIRVAASAGADPAEIRVYLLGTVFAALLHQRGLLPLHVGAVATRNGAVAFAGVSGAGKSTLAAALAGHGYPLLSDDTAVVTVDDEGPVLYPGLRRIKLWRDAVARLDLEAAVVGRDCSRYDKFHLAAPGIAVAGPQPLRALVLLQRSDDDSAAIRPLKTAQALSGLVAHTYRRGILQRMGAAATHFQRCAEIAGRLSVVEYRRPWVLEHLEANLEPLLEFLGDPWTA